MISTINTIAFGARTPKAPKVKTKAPKEPKPLWAKDLAKFERSHIMEKLQSLRLSTDYARGPMPKTASEGIRLAMVFLGQAVELLKNNGTGKIETLFEARLRESEFKNGKEVAIAMVAPPQQGFIRIVKETIEYEGGAKEVRTFAPHGDENSQNAKLVHVLETYANPDDKIVPATTETVIGEGMSEKITERRTNGTRMKSSTRSKDGRIHADVDYDENGKPESRRVRVHDRQMERSRPLNGY